MRITEYKIKDLTEHRGTCKPPRAHMLAAAPEQPRTIICTAPWKDTSYYTHAAAQPILEVPEPFQGAIHNQVQFLIPAFKLDLDLNPSS